MNHDEAVKTLKERSELLKNDPIYLANEAEYIEALDCAITVMERNGDMQTHIRKLEKEAQSSNEQWHAHIDTVQKHHNQTITRMYRILRGGNEE
jgi:ribosome recycling factor